MLRVLSEALNRRLHVLSLVSLAGVFGATGAMACPNWQLAGQELRYSADQLWSPQSFSVMAGGSANLANCPVPGRGYADARPNFDLTLTDNSARRELTIRVTASCDTVLLVNGANGQWSFNDDTDGLNPRISLPDARAGVYDIWVGTYSPTPCQATLYLETMGGGQVTPPPPPPPPPVAACPDPGQNGQMLTYDAAQLWQAQRFGVVAGGDLNLRNCTTVSGHGQIIQRPDFTLNLTGNAQSYDLEFRVEASCDPVLLVNGANGQWHFNDDADGLNSRLRIPRAQPGLYDVWVGTYGQNTCQATLIAETFGGQVTPPPPPPQPPVFGGLPAAAGEWSITGNGHQGYLRLDWGPNGWSGIVMYGGGGVETLQDLRYDPATGSIEFTRPLGSNTQHYRGQLVGTEMRGTFNQGGGDYRYNWHATLRQAQAGTVTPPQTGAAVPAAAGVWRINGNNYPGTLTLTWSGAGWSGVVNYDVYRRDEPLENIRFDPTSGSIEFTRPISGATQIYRGRLTGSEMRGEFNQAGGPYQYTWSATLSSPQAPATPAAPPPVSGGATK